VGIRGRAHQVQGRVEVIEVVREREATVRLRQEAEGHTRTRIGPSTE